MIPSASTKSVRRIGTCLIAPVVILLASRPLRAEDFDRYSGFTVPADPVLPFAEVHPSLYFHCEEIPDLIARKTDGDYSKIYKEIERDASFYLTADAAEQDYANRPKMAKTLAFWWLLNGNREALYGCIDALLLAFDDVPPGTELPFNEIRRATWLQNYCAAYDWVFPELTEQQNSAVRSRIIAQTQWLRDNLIDGIIHSTLPENHRGKTAWAIGTAALTFSSRPEASDWLAFALAQQNSVTRYMFSADGIYREGGHYWVFSAVNFIPFLYHYSNVSGVDLFPYYQPVFEWPVKIRMGSGWIPNYEDGFLQIVPTHMVAKRYLDSTTHLHSALPLGNILQWNFLATDIHQRYYTGATADATWEIDEFILTDSSIEPAPPDIPPTIKLEGGQIAFRNRWEKGKGQRYLLFQGVAEACTHNHPDQLSFVMSADDAYLIVDAGYGKRGYPDERRFSWYLLPEAHNIITVDSLPPSDPSENVAPETVYYIDSGFFGFAEKRAGFGLQKPHVLERAIGFIGRSYWVVADIVRGGREKSRIQSYLHGRGDFMLQANHATWVTGESKYGRPGVCHAYLFPRSGEIGVQEGMVSLYYDEYPEKFVVHQQVAEQAAFLKLLIPGSPGGSPPLVQDASQEGCLAVHVQSEDTTDTFLLQIDAGDVQIDPLWTNGTFAWSREIHERLCRFAFRECSRFGFKNQFTILCDPPSTLAVDITPFAISLHGSEHDKMKKLKFHFAGDIPGISEVRLNDERIDFYWNQDTLITGIPEFPEWWIEPERRNGPCSITYFPNPFNLETSIEINITKDDFYCIEIYNQTGQRIKLIGRGFLRENTYRFKWNGKDDHGRLLPTGIYIVRLGNGGAPAADSPKILLLR